MPVSKRTTKKPPKSAGARTELTPLTDKEQQFVLHFTTTCNFTEPQRAAVLAGYAESRAHVQAYEILARPNVVKAIEEAKTRVRQVAEQEAGITLGEVVAKLAQMAMFDIRRLYDEAGNILRPDMWPDDVAAAISGLEVFEEFEDDPEGGKTRTGQTKKVKVVERTKALDMLMKYLGGYDKDNRQKGQGGTDAVNELINVIRKVSGDACRLPIAPTNPG